MRDFFLMLIAVSLLHASAHSADKVRITVSGLSGQFMTFPLAQKRGFLKEEGIEAEIIRITGAASRTALWQRRSRLQYGTRQ
jgi:ABC-type nitrate/sulfonate/bicarbonate transport system substrate-binding protein